jgi:AraC family transcriptional regulator, activator of mtrCDE
MVVRLAGEDRASVRMTSADVKISGDPQIRRRDKGLRRIWRIRAAHRASDRGYVSSNYRNKSDAAPVKQVMRDVSESELLDDLLSALSIRARIVFRGMACERWGIGGVAGGRLGFHFVLDGNCWARVPEDAAPVELGAGALLLHRPCVSQLLSDSRDAACRTPPVRIEALSHSATGTHLSLLCGYFDGAGMYSPLIEALPPYLLWTRLAELPVPVVRLTQTLIACAFDTSRVGEQVLARLCEVLLLMILREPSVLPRERIGTLRGRCDPALRHAFDAIHAHPARSWSLDTLARRAGLSRSTFAQRFNEAAGIPPMTYLRRYRLAIAEKRMSDGHPVEQAAREVGYGSIAAFRRARQRVERVSGSGE